MSPSNERSPQIIAIGGSSLRWDSDVPDLEGYILEQTGVAHPKVCFLPTASGDDKDYIINFYSGMLKLDCRPTHLCMFERVPDLKETLLAQDVIYVGGGNTKSMLGLWQEYGLPEILRQAWHQGIILCGSSAGAICWFEQTLTDALAGKLSVLNCLGFLPGSLIPHYDSDVERRPAYHQALLQGEILPGYALDDYVALHYIGDRLQRVISARPGLHAYHVHKAGVAVIEDELAVEIV